MGSPQPQVPVAAVQLSSQHERLILDLLPFKDIRQFYEWLNGVYVRGSWNEFVRDFLSSRSEASEPDKTKTTQRAKDTLNSRDPRYLMYHPRKEGWSVEDHYIRFIVTVISDNQLKGLWSESDWKKRGLEITKAVYEVLSFLRAVTVIPANPPSYEA
ncbi:hypothetical protein MFIFM68171_06855 [Madurella fahalii]|uniref:Uncharacterized protein n=1 Tax=Madurella fahalii TaxID=1157608 RepID=A0ABQ0GG29_9PEZI